MNKKPRKTDIDMAWKVNTPAFFQEILTCNPHMGILQIPVKIFLSLLASVADRANKINDSELHSLMARLALYESCDPYSKEYDGEVMRKAVAGEVGLDMVAIQRASEDVVYARDQYLSWKKAHEAEDWKDEPLEMMHSAHDVLMDKLEVLDKLIFEPETNDQIKASKTTKKS